MAPQNKNQDQLAMFERSPHAARVEHVVDMDALPPIQQVDSHLHPHADPNPGPSVSIEAHRKHLVDTLDSLAQVSKRAGLQVAAETGRRRALESRYEDVDALVGRATENKHSMYREAESSFGKALGSTAMVEAGLMTADEARSEDYRQFDAFKQKYSGATNHKRLVKYRKKLKRAGS